MSEYMCVDGITYHIIQTSKSAIVTKIDDMEVVKIPYEILDCTVTEIESSACCNRTKVKHVSIPAGVRIIRDAAFFGCRQLMFVEIHSSNVKIHSFAFAKCARLTTFSAYNVQIQGTDVFCGCSKIQRFTTPNQPIDSVFVGAIPRGTFYGCKKLQRLCICNADINSTAFFGCADLKTIRFYGAVKMKPDIESFVRKRTLECKEDSVLIDLVFDGTTVVII